MLGEDVSITLQFFLEYLEVFLSCSHFINFHKKTTKLSYNLVDFGLLFYCAEEQLNLSKIWEVWILVEFIETVLFWPCQSIEGFR